MIRFLILSASVFIFFSCGHRHQTQANRPLHDTALRILTYGLPDPGRTRAAGAVAKKWGFSYVAVAGCIVTTELLDSVNRENARVYGKLADRYGANWQKKFDREVDTMRQWQQRAEDLVKRQPFIRAKQAELARDTASLDYFIAPTSRPEVFAVEAYTWQQKDQRPGPLTCFQLTVNISTQTVTRN